MNAALPCRICDGKGKIGVSLVQDRKYTPLLVFVVKYLHLKVENLSTFLCQDCLEKCTHWRNCVFRHQLSQLYFEKLIAMAEAAQHMYQLLQMQHAVYGHPLPEGIVHPPLPPPPPQPPQQANQEPDSDEENQEPANEESDDSDSEEENAARNNRPVYQGPFPPLLICASCGFFTLRKVELRIHIEIHQAFIAATRRRRKRRFLKAKARAALSSS